MSTRPSAHTMAILLGMAALGGLPLVPEPFDPIRPRQKAERAAISADEIQRKRDKAEAKRARRAARNIAAATLAKGEGKV